jgi:hypothetical protein
MLALMQSQRVMQQQHLSPWTQREQVQQQLQLLLNSEYA